MIGWGLGPGVQQRRAQEGQVPETFRREASLALVLTGRGGGVEVSEKTEPRHPGCCAECANPDDSHQVPGDPLHPRSEEQPQRSLFSDDLVVWPGFLQKQTLWQGCECKATTSDTVGSREATEDESAVPVTAQATGPAGSNGSSVVGEPRAEVWIHRFPGCHWLGAAACWEGDVPPPPHFAWSCQEGQAMPKTPLG